MDIKKITSEICRKVNERINEKLERQITTEEINEIIQAIAELKRGGNLSAEADNNERIINVFFKNIVGKATASGAMNKMALPDVHKYMMEELKTSDNPIKFDGKKSTDAEFIAFKLDNNLLRTQFITQYIALDNYYLAENYTSSFFLSNLIFQLTANEQSSNNSVISLKYPLAEIIRFDIQPFFVPYYMVYNGLAAAPYNGYAIVRAPPGKKIQITISEILESYKTSPAQNYTTLATMQYDSTTYDGTNLPFISTVTPANNSIFTFRYPLKYLMQISMKFNDMLNDMLFPSPFLYSNTITKANPTIITILSSGSTGNNPAGTCLIGGERIYISGFSSTSAADSEFVLAFNNPEGYIASLGAGAYNFTIPIDSAAMTGSPAAVFRVFVACRRIIIPITIQQLRPEVSGEIN